MPRPPTRNRVTSPYGMRRHPITGDVRMHWGEDRGWGGADGTTLVAPEAGEVFYWGYNSQAGNRLRIRGESGALHSLAHNSARWPRLEVGDRVDEGQPVSVMGSTGAAAGVHVHWEVEVDGELIDPQAWLYQFASSGDVTPITPNVPEEDDMKLRFITRDGSSQWFVTDGMRKRPIGPGEDRLLVDLGLAVYEEGDAPVKVIGSRIDGIPVIN